MNRLQQIQNCLARTAVEAPKASYITPILRSLYWFTINERIEYKLLSFTYKDLTTSQPDYLHNQSYLCSVYVQNPLLISCHPSSTIRIFLITNHQPLFLWLSYFEKAGWDGQTDVM